MRPKHKLNTPLIKTEYSDFSNTVTSQSLGGIAHKSNSATEDHSQHHTYQSFDTYIDNNDEHSRKGRRPSSFYNPHLSDKRHKVYIIENIIIGSILFIIGTTIIILSILAHDTTNDYIININLSEMILSTSIGACFVFCSLCKLTITCFCQKHKSLKHTSITYIFSVISCIIALTLSIFGFLHYYNHSFIDTLSYPLWLNITLLSYAAFIILTIIILKILPPNHYNDIEISLPYESIHKNAPDYILNDT
eukprot:319276_1